MTNTFYIPVQIKIKFHNINMNLTLFIDDPNFNLV